jgi:hydrogenase-4 component B
VWDGALGALTLAALAATVALGALCFVKVIGLVLLGPARTAESAQATEAPATMRGAVVALAGACVALGTVPGLLFGRLVELAPWGAQAPERAGLSLPGTGGLPTAGIACVLVGIATIAWLARGTRRAPAAATWACGQAIEPSLRWTSAGFSKPLRLMLEPILRPQREIEVRTRHGVVQEVAYSSRMPNVIDDYLYRPVTRGGLAAAGWARRLQSGRLGTYVAYLVGLVLALLFAVRIGLLG